MVKTAEYIEREAAYRFAQDQLKKETGAYSRGWNHAMNVMKSALHNNDALPAADVVPVVHGKWVLDGVQMIINLENAREQYKELGYPHRNELRMRCSNCKKITMVDASIRYEYCPHCGADMREVEHENG